MVATHNKGERGATKVSANRNEKSTTKGGITGGVREEAEKFDLLEMPSTVR